MELKHASVKPGEERGTNTASRFAAKAVLIGSLAFVSCTPDVTVKIIMDNGDAGKAAPVCRVVALDEGKTVDLRLSGNAAGPNSVPFSGGTLTLVSIDDKDSTKTAKLQLAGCNGKAIASLKGGELATLSIASESYVVEVVEIVYEANGPRVRVKVTPVDDTVRKDASPTDDVVSVQVQADAPVVAPADVAAVMPMDTAAARVDAPAVAPVDTAAPIDGAPAPVDSGNSKADSGVSG